MAQLVTLSLPTRALDDLHIIADAAKGDWVKVPRNVLVSLLMDHSCMIRLAQRLGAEIIDEPPMVRPKLHKRR